MQRWIERLEDGLFLTSRTMGSPWGPVLRLLRFPVALVRDWLTGEINVQAMSLAYTTLLALVPLLVFIFSILKGLGVRDDLQLIIFEFFRPMGSDAGQLTAHVMQYAENMRGGIAGSIGFVLLVYTVIAAVQKIESSFNFVWRVMRPRNLARRLSEYFGIMIIGPLLMASVVGMLSSAQHGAAARWVGTVIPATVPYLLVTLVFTFLYSFIPNTKVKPQAAVIGGITAGITWAVLSNAFAAFILYSSQMAAVYTGFAVVLTALIWVYLNWLILLLGAQLAFYVQYPQYLRHGQETAELSGSARETAGLSVMMLVGRSFCLDESAGKRTWTSNNLAAALDIPSTSLAPVINCLERAGLLVATEKEYFLPGRDIAEIPISEVLAAIRTRQPGRLLVTVHAEAPAIEIIDQVEAAMRERMAGRSLKDLIELR